LRSLLRPRAVHVRDCQQQSTQQLEPQRQRKQKVRRTRKAHVEPVCVVPPVVEDRVVQHAEAAPRRHKRPQRRTQPPDAYAVPLHLAVVPKRRREDQVAACNRRKHARRVQHHVRRVPETIAPDRAMPRHIEVQAQHSANDRSRRRPDKPRHAKPQRLATVHPLRNIARYRQRRHVPSLPQIPAYKLPPWTPPLSTGCPQSPPPALLSPRPHRPKLAPTPAVSRTSFRSMESAALPSCS